MRLGISKGFPIMEVEGGHIGQDRSQGTFDQNLGVFEKKII